MNTCRKKGFMWRTCGTILFSFGLLVVLVACGGQSANGAALGPSDGGKPPAKQAVPSSTVANNGPNGCPNKAVVTDTPAKANVTVSESMINTDVIAHTGDIIEVRLPFGQNWSGPTSSQGVLLVQDPSGYAIQSDHVCVWRFQAKASGSTPLNFTGRAICTQGKMCPLYIESMSFSIDVRYGRSLPVPEVCRYPGEKKRSPFSIKRASQLDEILLTKTRVIELRKTLVEVGPPSLPAEMA
jgi:hypothetical protein